MSKSTRILITTPQFERSPDDPKPIDPPDADLLWSLAGGEGDVPTLREYGLRRWDKAGPDEFGDDPFDGQELWLLPGEWSECLPRGLPVVDIFGRLELVDTDTDMDIRFGYLAFGFLRDPS